MKKKLASIYLNAADYKQFRLIAKARKVSAATLIRQAMAEWLTKQGEKNG